MKVLPGYNYKGFIYMPWSDYEKDNVKIYHDVKKELYSGKFTTMDWSPYGTPTVEEFERWVDLDFPGRKGSGPLNSEILLDMWLNRS
jgi:hypothetical protein